MGGRNNFRRGIIMPTLISQIKSILEQYPDDGQMLKEIIQNAEDAGATKVVFVMDHSTYGTDPSKLHHPDMVNYQGPALLAYNNASFIEKDWKGIRTLHESVKADDPLKVGKFGLGFKSIFHMTDLPSIYSGRVVGFLDPHTRFFEVSVQGQSRPEKTTSYCWDFEVEEDFEEVRNLSHLFQPFLQDIFGTNEIEFGTEHFEGTMFRFPLRNNTMHSDLSSNCYDGNKIKQLLKSLEAESDIIFLFLKNIKRIEFYEKINGKTTRLLDIKIPDNDIASVNLGTTELAAHINSNALNWYKKESKSVSYRLPIEVTKEGGGGKKLTTWMVTQHFGGASSRPSAEQSVDGNLPLVGIASKSIGDNTTMEPYGQIFCFMPLPREEKSPTGFYFHVHGSFAVDQNRRHLKWMSADQDPSKITDKDLIWNNFLLEKLLPVCLEDHYKYLISDHKMANWMDNDSLNDSAEIIYKILPDEEIVNHHWMRFVSTFMKLFRSLELFSITTSTWRSTMSYILNHEKDEITNLNLRILTKSNFDLARLPKHLVKFISKHEQKLSADCICMNLKSVQQNISCTEHEQIILLKFFLEDLSNITALQGIQLLPLHDGSWIQFGDKFSKNKIFIFNKQYPDTLFPGLKNQFLSPNKLSSNLTDKLINNFNFQQIDKNIFSKLLRKMLSEFVVDEVRLGSHDWFNYEWLASVWTCLKRDFHDNLNMFSELHLILVSTDKVVKLTQKPTIIGTSLSDKTVEQHFKNICHSLGIIFVETHQHNEIYNHLCLWDKIILPTRIRSILKFVMPMSEAEYMDGFDKLHSSEIDYFVAGIVSEITRQPLTSDEINILKKLKIFRTIKGSGKQDVKAVSLSSVNVSLKNSAPHYMPVPSCIPLVDLSKSSANILATSLSIRLLYDDMYLKEAYIPGIQRGFYTDEEVQLLMKYVCTNFRNIPTDLITELKRLSFITRGKDGLLSRPQELFDHKDETLINLLDSNKFPCESWRNPNFHCSLINLGLKGVRDITSNDCLEIINNIAGMSSSEKSVKSKILLNFMNKNSHLLDESLKLKIEDVNWIKIKKSRPSGYPKELKYLGEETNQEYARFTDVISSKFENISGSTCLLTECKNLNAVGKLLGWNESPPLHLVVKHFKNFIDTFHLSNKMPNTEVYEILDSFTKEELVGAMDHEFPWVWTGNEFVPPRKIVINRPKIDLKPYVFTLPAHLQQFKNLWKSLNISLNADLIKCLSLINDYHETSKSNDKERVDQDLNLAVNILNSLADCGITTCDPIFVPIQTSDGSSLRMKLIEHCAYCDKNWFQRGFDIDDLDSNTYLINEKIPMKIAEKLQIASCLGKLLNVEEFQCNWGQEESLTTRLKNILKEYTDGLTVLKELVQNADDAGATEISFVYDERRNEDSRTILLDENMKELQGAAIWCHNDAVFSEDDFKNITKLGGETKHLMSTKIGKFGLGFNSVYNLTDVPMFYSNDSVVIFDPHKKYLGKLLNNRSPGIRLRLKGNHQKVSRLKDQFAPFNGLFGCDFTQICEHYPGTLFRLPLRTKNQANKSELIKKHYSRNEVIQLFECLMKSGEDLLLFTQSLCKIKFYHIDEDSIVSNMTEIYSVSRTILNVIENAPMVENTFYLKAVSKQLHERATNEFMLSMEIKETFNQVCNLGSLEKKDKNDKWIVSWYTGAGGSFELYLRNKSYLPIGSVAAKFSNNNDIGFQENFEGKYFCFLPLPSTQSLPVHVNGYFALNSSRTHIHARVKNDKIDDRCIWNEELLKDAVAMAYCNLIRYLALNKISDHYYIFPSMSNWWNNQLLVESFYSKLFELNLKVFRSIVDYKVYGYSECRILGCELRDKCFSESVEKVLIDISKLRGNKVLLKLSSNIYDCLQQIDYKNNFQSKVIYMKEFYEDWFIPNLDRIDKSERETIIMETLIDARLQHFLVEHVCIPVTPRGECLESIGQLVDPESPLAPLYDNEDQMFPFVSKCLESKKRIYFETLIKLGMRTNTLNEEEIIDRCHSIEARPQSVDSRLPILLDLIEDLLKKRKRFYPQRDEKLFLHEIKYIKMFPGKLKPEKFPLFWKQESPCLTSCTEGFLESKMLVAASSNIIIDEDRSFKGNYQLMKSHLELEDKRISFESLKIVILGIEKHFGENENYSIKQDSLAVEMTSIIHQIYCEIKQMNENNLFDQSSMSALSKMRLILTNSQPCRLLSPDQCRKNIHRSLLPHMCGVNETSLANATLMQSIVGIKDCFLVDDFVQLLKMIESSFRGIQLVNPTLDLVFRIIECLLHELQFGERPPECFLPNKLGILCLSSKLKYNDCEWVALESSQYCHDNISFEKAKKLGIISVRKNHLDCYGLPFPFGQKEELVNRINRILAGYPLNESIFKEMLQNADDAMATEIHFINDSRQLSNKKIFCDEWKPLQGPALCVYNDKSFTLNDLKGIQKLGEGSKQNDITKTGQYGVGFNCVYHLTDVPSFLTTVKSDELKNGENISGTVLAIFDPNCAFLPKSEIDISNPGALYNSEVVTDMFTDVYEGYLQGIKTYDVSKSGTIFRLPLRNEASKSKSRIEGETINSDKNEKRLKDLFKADSHLCLLFMKSLESIHIVSVSSASSSKLIQNISLKLSDEATAKKEKFMKSTKELAFSLQNKTYNLREIISQEVIYEVEIQDSNSRPSDWIIVQRFGFEDTSKISLLSFDSHNLCLQPIGGVAFNVDNFDPKKYTSKSKIFNFLPLPDNTNLPVHINGHFVLNHEDRRGLWKYDEQSYKTQWNKTIISQIIAPAYCSFLSYMKQRGCDAPTQFFKNEKNVSDFYGLFPKKQFGEYVNLLVIETYKYIVDKKLKLFMVYDPHNEGGIQWTCVDEQIYFDDLDAEFSGTFISEPKLINKLLCEAKFLRDHLYYCGMKIIVAPIFLWKEIQNAGFKNIKRLTHENVYGFISSSSSLFDNLPQSIKNTPFRSVEGIVSVLEYIADQLKSDVELLNLPFLLNSKEVLNKATEGNAVFESKYRDVAPHKSGEFVHLSVERFYSKETKFIKQLSVSDLPQLFKEFVNLFQDVNNLHKLKNIKVFDEYFCETSASGKWLTSVWNYFGNVLENEVLKNKDILESKVLKSIHYFCIIPVIINDKEFLYPICKSTCVLRPLASHDETLKKLFLSLKTVGTPLLDVKFLGGCKRANILKLFGNIDRLGDVLMFLEEVYINLKLISNVPNEEGLEILKYFSNNCPGLTCHENGRRILCSLPFYIDMNGCQVIPNFQPVYVIPAEIPSFDTRIVGRHIICLKDDYSLRRLFEFLKFKSLTVHEAYTFFIFDAFKHFDPKNQFEHLQVVRKHADMSYNEDDFMKSLKKFEFIIYDGQLRKASYFYDKTSIFKIMETHFLPEPFDSSEWRYFVVKCGLNTELCEDKFLEYAHKISSLNSDTYEVQLIMIEWLAVNINKKYKICGGFLEKLKTIPFMYPSKIERGLLELHPKFNKASHIHFQNSVLQKDGRLCWTISNILPQMVDNRLHTLFDILNVKTTVDSTAVLRNLRNISDAVEKKLNGKRSSTGRPNVPNANGIDIDLIKRLTEEHLTWFHNKTLGKDCINGLKNIKCLYVDDLHALVRPNQVVTDITSHDQIHPYITKLPNFYGKFEKLLMSLGATKEITVEQCARSLEEIKDKVKDQKMDPNNKHIAQKLFKVLLKCIRDDKISEFDGLKQLFLPCEGDILCDSKSIYCSSNSSINCDIAGPPVIVSDKIDLLFKLPESIRPMNLDKYMTVEVADLGKDITIDVIEGLKMNLKHPNFLGGLLRIKLHSSESSNDNLNESEIFDYFQTKLKKLLIFEKETISVHHILNAKIIEKKNVPYFVKHDLQKDSLEIYVASDLSFSIFTSGLSKKLACFFDIQNSASIIDKILTSNPLEIDRLLDMHKIGSLDYIKTPPLGTEIQIEDHFRLVQDMLIFHPQQLVAYEIDDPFDRDMDGDPKYILVEIIRVQGNFENIQKYALKYEINFGSHKEVVPALKLFAFETICGKQILIISNSCGDEYRETPADVSEVIEKLKIILKEIWKLEELEKKKAIKRLYLTYHPDKNLDNRRLFDEIFKHLKILINKLENGQSIDHYVKSTDGDNCDKNSHDDYEGRSDCRQGYFERMNRRANQHCYSNNKKGRKYRNTHGTPRMNKRAFFNDFSTKHRKDPYNAELWMKQARHDAEVAMNDLNSNLRSSQWVCIKLYQAIRNAITAVNYAKNADQMPAIKNNLKNICSEIYDQCLDSLVEQADEILVGFEYLAQPRCSRPAFENITKEMADDAEKLTRRILSRCDELMAT